jgi:hypothetical protein
MIKSSHPPEFNENFDNIQIKGNGPMEQDNFERVLLINIKRRF